MRVDTGSFDFVKGRVTLRGGFLDKDTSLRLEPFPRKYAKGHAREARFQLIGPDLPFGGHGPVELPVGPHSIVIDK